MDNAEIKRKLLRRFASLIKKGQQNKDREGLEWNEGWGSKYASKEDPKYYAWMAQVEDLLYEVLPSNSPLIDEIKQMQKMSRRHVVFEKAIGLLKGVEKDVKAGTFGFLKHCIELVASTDYLEQAKSLMADKTDSMFSYVPAAVLAGAVLENRLRMLCQSAKPPIETKKDNGCPKKMTEMIDCLRKADIVNEVCAKHLRAWSDIRNAAAHYRPNDITAEQVSAMIKGVEDFVTSKVS